MAQLLIRNLDEELVKKLKARAAQRNVSMAEELRDIVKSALTRTVAPKTTFKEFLKSMPEIEIRRRKDLGRKVRL